MKLSIDLIVRARFQLFSPLFLRNFSTKAVSVRIVEMILHLSLGGFLCTLLRTQAVHMGQVGAMADLPAVAGLIKFGCLLVVASRLFMVLRWCVMMFCCRHGNRKIRWLGVSRISNEEFCSSRHDISYQVAFMEILLPKRSVILGW